MGTLRRILAAVWHLAIMPQPARFLLSVLSGALLRALIVLCFVATIQALLVAAKPGSGYLHKITSLEHFAPLTHRREALFMAMIVIILFILQFILQHIYQSQVGKGITNCSKQLYLKDIQGAKNYISARRAGAIMYDASVKSGEICVFLLTLYGLLLWFDWRIFAAMFVLGGLSLATLIYTFRHSPWRLKAREAQKQSLLRSSEAELNANITKYDEEDEKVRFRRLLAPGIEGLTIAAFTAFLVIALAESGVDTRGHSVLAIVLVFSMRYAIVYIRDLGRSLNSIFELRTEQLVMRPNRAGGI
ncbi:MAG: hypothetical protein QM744_14110 [Mesorhizobium sp.]